MDCGPTLDVPADSWRKSFQVSREFLGIVTGRASCCFRQRRARRRGSVLRDFTDNDRDEIGQGTPRTGRELHRNRSLTQQERYERVLTYDATDLSGSSLDRRLDFSRQTARLRDWNTPLSVLLGVGNSYATGTLRVTKPRGGARSPDAAASIRLVSRTPAGRKRRDKTCLGDEGELPRDVPTTRPLHTNAHSPLANRRTPCTHREFCLCSALGVN
jgi:hypothetical protein